MDRSLKISRKSVGKNFIYDVIGSTNVAAKELFNSGDADHGSLIVANRQTAGKGRLGRSFYSPADTGLYMSVVIRPEGGASHVTKLTAVAALAVCHAIETIAPELSPGIKWVNDIYISGRKICGILAEGIIMPGEVTLSAVVIGIGVNCTTADFPDEISGVAGSLGVALSREALCAEICDNLLEFCRKLDEPWLIEEYRRRSMILGRDVHCFGGGVDIYARAVDIDSSGGLIVESESGERHTLTSGEISLRIDEKRSKSDG